MKDNLILEKTFDYSNMVICGDCKGTKTVLIENKREQCRLCNGQGVLKRVTTGTMKLYTTDFEINPIKGNV